MSLDFTNYAGLKAAIADFAERPDLEDKVPGCIQLAEERLQQAIRLRTADRVVTGTLTAGVDHIDLPDEFFIPRFLSLEGDPFSKLDVVSVFEFKRRQNDEAGASVPSALLMSALTIKLAPTPTANTPYTLFGYGGIVPLSEAVGFTTNWLLRHAKNALLFASLDKLGIYMGGDPRRDEWRDASNEAIGMLESVEAMARTGGGPLRMRSAGWTP